MLTEKSLTEEFAREICLWQYENEFKIYNSFRSYDEMKKENLGFANPDKNKNYKAFVNENNMLIGYIHLTEKEDAFSLGIGIAPKFCLMGYGKEILKITAKKIKKFSNKKIQMQVRTWNKPAINCYLSSGFKIIKTFKMTTPIGEGEFFLMEY